MARRNHYDTDVTMWSPEGRLYQVEYAEAAVNQGTICLGLRNDDFCVLGGIKRAPNPLASFQEKLFEIDSHMGIGMSGLTADARSLVKYMRSEALNHKYVYGAPIQGSRLVLDVADMHQKYTMTGSRRPLGVGLLVGTYDQTGAHLYETKPSGNYYEYYAMAIGARSQTARTYLEGKFESFKDCSLDELIKHALRALAATLSSDFEMDVKSASIAVMGKGRSYQTIEGAELQRYLDEIDREGGVVMEQETAGSGSSSTGGGLENPDI